MASKSSIKINSYLVVILSISLIVTQAVSPSRTWFYLLCVLVGLTLLAYFWTRELRKGISLERKVRRGLARVGDVLEEEFTLYDDSFIPGLWAEIVDHSTLPGYVASRVESVGPLGKKRWTTSGACLRRGVFEIGPLEVHMGDPFGLFSTTLHFPDVVSFLVYPPIVELPRLDLPRGLISGSSRSSARSQQLTTSAAGIRSYMPGDSLRRIHWPSTARLGELFVKEFDLEPSGDLWVVLDLEKKAQAGEEEESTQEYGIIVAASLADRLLRENRGVGLVAWDAERTVVPLERGHSQLWRIMEKLVLISQLGEEPLSMVLASLELKLGWGTSVVVITASCDPSWVSVLLGLTRRGAVPMAILLDPASFGGTGNVSAMRKLLTEEGINSYLIRKGYDFRRLWPEEKPRVTYRTLGTGRVIPVVSPR